MIACENQRHVPADKRMSLPDQRVPTDETASGFLPILIHLVTCMAMIVNRDWQVATGKRRCLINPNPLRPGRGLNAVFHRIHADSRFCNPGLAAVAHRSPVSVAVERLEKVMHSGRNPSHR
jgi:hypothetical protein